MSVWLSSDALVSINVVILHRARLVPQWVTVSGQENHPGAEPGTQVYAAWTIPPWVGAMSEQAHYVMSVVSVLAGVWRRTSLMEISIDVQESAVHQRHVCNDVLYTSTSTLLHCFQRRLVSVRWRRHVIGGVLVPCFMSYSLARWMLRSVV